MKAYSSPDEWYRDAQDWQKPLIATIRDSISSAAAFDQEVKYGNLFFLHAGPAMMIRHEEDRVIFGLFRGKRLRGMDSRLKASGKYELANIVLKRGDAIHAETVRQLAETAAQLNDELGDPTLRK